MNPLAPAPTLSPAPEPPPSAGGIAPPTDDERLREALKRCPPACVEAACLYRKTGEIGLLPVIVRGVIARYADREHRARLEQPADDVQLVADLGLDSLTMMEIVMLAEDVFPVTIANEELRTLRTVGDVQRFIECKLRGEPPPSAVVPCDCQAAVSLPTAAAEKLPAH